MAELVAIGYPDTVSAPLALDELQRFSRDFVIRCDEMAALVREEDGNTKAFTFACITGDAPAWAMLWTMLFALLYYVPILGIRVSDDVAAILESVERSGIDTEFQDRARKILEPGTSVLFCIVEKVSVDRIAEALDEFGGTVLQAPLSERAQRTLREVLHGRDAVAT
jgi:uncharacterized membrane protein